MRTNFLVLNKNLVTILALVALSCQKDYTAPKAPPAADQKAVAAVASADEEFRKSCLKSPPFNLEVVLWGAKGPQGHIHFRQDPDAAKIITLDTRIHHLLPNHEYLLQRAVDPINVVDGVCTSTTWLTLGLGLTPQSIFTDENGSGEEELWRDVTAIASGSTFDIHFRIVDAATQEVVLTSDCYQYMVR